MCRWILFFFSKRSLPFLTVDATLGNQAFSHDGCDMFPGLSHNKTNNMFLNSLRKNEVEAQLEFTWKIMERASYDVTVKKDSLLVYVPREDKGDREGIPYTHPIL